MNPKILPVIHFLNRATTFSEVETAIAGGSDGCFLISHRGQDDSLVDIAYELQQLYPEFPIGINLLSKSAEFSAKQANLMALPMVWADDAGVDSRGLSAKGESVQRATHDMFATPKLEVFASVAFKYQPVELNPVRAACCALYAGFTPTTSGAGTGEAPELAKIKDMYQATDGVLAVASGMTVENIAEYAPFLSHVLVATGIAADEHHMDLWRLRALIANSKG